MRFLFIWPAPGALGGIETLMARMSRWLLAHGHEVTLLVHKDDHWTQTLPKDARCIVLGDRFRELNFHFHARRLWKLLNLPEPDVIKSFDLTSAWIACQLAASMGNRCRVVAGMYGAFFFKWYFAADKLPLWSANKLYLANYLHGIDGSARVFCGVDGVEELQEIHQQDSLLWPTPIDTSVFTPAARKPVYGKIVSVGRLDVMKQYNLYMVDVVQELVRRGHHVTWTVYGTGDHDGAVRARVRAAGLDGVISMAGAVPYHKLWEVLSDAYVFVGMGTAVLEAALFGVPNVVALAYDRIGLTYGPSYKAPPGSMVPSLACPPTLRVCDEIERVLRLGPKEYEAEQQLVRDHVQPHDIDASMNQFLKLAREARPMRKMTGLYLLNYLSWLFRQGMGRRATPRFGHPEATLFSDHGPAVDQRAMRLPEVADRQ